MWRFINIINYFEQFYVFPTKINKFLDNWIVYISKLNVFLHNIDHLIKVNEAGKKTG